MSFTSKRLDQLSAYSIPKKNGKHARMDQNENSLFPHEKLVIEPELMGKYPDLTLLRKTVAEKWEIEKENLMFFNGASEAIMCSALSFIDPCDTAIVTRPEFALIPHYLKLAGAFVVEVSLTGDYQFDSMAIEKELESQRKIFFTSNPHNPSGAVLDLGLVEKWCRKHRNTLFIIDETYASFWGSSILPNVSKHTNLMVIRSFSKDSALAGLRLGAAVGPAELIESMASVRTPYSVNAAAVQAALRLVSNNERFTDQLKRTGANLENLAFKTEEAGFTVLRGNGNFFLVKDEKSESFYTFCRERDVILRRLSEGLLRISPSDEEGNTKYLDCLTEWRRI